MKNTNQSTVFNISGLRLLKSSFYNDERGFLEQIYNLNEFENFNTFLENRIFSYKNVFRGLHIQIGVHSQGKILRLLRGEIVDYIIDLRLHSETFLNIDIIKLDESERIILFIPEGCAHGFLTVSDESEVIYLANNAYNPLTEVTLNPHDPVLKLGIPDYLILSNKDKDESLILEDVLKIIYKEKNI